MKHPIIDKILIEWAYRVHDGMPNPKNPTHLVHLRKSLKYLKIDEDVIDLMMNKLYEDKQFYARSKKSGKVVPFTNKENWKSKIASGEYEKVSDEEGEKELGKQGEEPEKGGEDTKEQPPKEEPTTKKVTKMKDNQFDKKGDEEIEQVPTTEKIKQNRGSIFDNKVTGKGGGETSVQEEIAGISRQIAVEQPNLTEEEHKETIAQFIKDNYGDTHYGSKEKLINNLIAMSASGPETMKKIKSNKNMKFKDEQPEGFPVQITFTDGGTVAVKNKLEKKLKNASPEDKAHYENELKYFKKHATKETGVEGDGDTAIMYEDSDGRTRMIYVSNKQGLKDPHSNATVKSASKAIKDSIEPGTNEEALTSRLDDAVKGGIDANGDMVKTNRADIDSSIEELNKAPLTTIATKTLTGRAEFTDKTSDKYLNNCKKNTQVKDYIEKNKLDIDNPEHIVKAVVAVAGSGDADGLNDSTKQAPNKLLLKMTNSTASVRVKMQRLIDKGKTPEEATEIVANSKQKGKPLMGGNLSSDDCLSIYNNKALEKLEQNTQTRKEAMRESHEGMYNAVVELDVAHYMEQGMSDEEALEKYENEAGPNEQTYTKSFMKRMHWDRYIDGVDDDKKMIEIGDKAYSPKDFRDCLGKLTGWDGVGNLKEHIQKNMRIKSGTMKLSFVSKGKTVEIGDDTWRTAGDLSKIAGGLGKDMQQCLGSK
tara:strand:+ start:240 stop:2354 length:2115 start_codon:yes stop_codon:yes gene_type:complete